MVDEQEKKDDKFDFDAAGEVVSYVSLDQARVLAIQHTRDNPEFYGPGYSRVTMVSEVISQEETEDYYDIRLSFRPAGRFRGEPGVEQFTIDKTGNIEVRQVLDEPVAAGQPARRGPPNLVLVLAGVVLIVVVAAGVLYATGGGDTQVSAPASPAISPSSAPDSVATAAGVAAAATGNTQDSRPASAAVSPTSTLGPIAPALGVVAISPAEAELSKVRVAFIKISKTVSAYSVSGEGNFTANIGSLTPAVYAWTGLPVKKNGTPFTAGELPADLAQYMVFDVPATRETAYAYCWDEHGSLQQKQKGEMCD